MTAAFFSVAADPNMAVVAALGIGTVFAGLVSIVLILTIMNAIFGKIKPKEHVKPIENQVGNATDEKLDDETVAAVSAAIAQTLGRDVSGIRITSIKKIN